MSLFSKLDLADKDKIVAPLKSLSKRKKILLVFLTIFIFISLFTAVYYLNTGNFDIRERAVSNDTPALEINEINLSVNFQPHEQLSIMYEKYDYPSEVTPVILPNPDGRIIYMLSGGNSNICLSEQNALQQKIVLKEGNCLANATRNVITHPDNQGNTIWKDPKEVADEMVNFPWRFSYDGIFAAEINESTNKLLLVRYFEHQNYVYRWKSGFRECGDNPQNYYLYRSNIHTDISSDYCTCEEQSYVCDGWGDPNPLCKDGNNICPADLSGPEHDHSWASWAMGGTLGLVDYSSKKGYQLTDVVDEGPIIWPQQAYRTNNKNNYADVGAYEIIEKDGYNYLFSIIKPRENQNSGAACIAMSRSEVKDGGKPHSWKNYFQGSFVDDTLPNGFSKENISQFYETRGGRSDCIFPLPDEHEKQAVATWVSIAKFKDLPYYISVEETSPHWKTYQMAVRFSSDLIHWSKPQIIEEHSGANWGESLYTYPRFLNKEGTSNKEIDPEEFYLYGKGIGPYDINSMKMSLVFSGTPTPTPSPSPTPPPARSCNQSCKNDGDCGEGLACKYVGKFRFFDDVRKFILTKHKSKNYECRNPKCIYDSDCICSNKPTPSPMPIETPNPNLPKSCFGCYRDLILGKEQKWYCFICNHLKKIPYFSD